MGGGDLNSKKSWHPNTMKNQERVWKAEQAAAEEKRRIAELQKEHAQERERSELQDLVKSASGSTTDNRLSWMYNKPDKKGQQEEYLLGKSIEPNYGNSEKQDQDAIPALTRRVVGSSMLATSGDAQVDLTRKLREDPLALVKERERAARAALLNNPLHRRRLAEMLRKEQEQKKEKKKTSKKGSNLNEQLAAKLNALGGEKGINLAELLASDDDDSSSSSSSSSDEKYKKKKKKKKSKKKKSKKSEKQEKDIKTKHKKSEYDSSDDERNERKKQNSDNSSRREKRVPDNSRHDKNDSRYNKFPVHEVNRKSKETNYTEINKRRREHSRERHYTPRRHSRSRSRSRDKERSRKERAKEDDRAAKLAEMARAGAERERDRAQRVDRQRAAIAAEDNTTRKARTAAAPALPTSLEARLHSNRHYIQRGDRHMSENFARRQ